MNKHVSLEPAFVLHRWPYRNTSWILDLLTPHYGRVRAVAKSARGLRSRYKGCLEWFAPLLVSWNGSESLRSLGNVELYGMPYMLSGNALLSAFYIHELLIKLLHPDDAHPYLFEAYKLVLRRLMHQEIELGLRYFEKCLLQEIGYGLPLERELSSGKVIQSHRFYKYIPERGFLLSDQEGGYTLFSGADLLAIGNNEFGHPDILKTAKRLMRLALHQVLGGRAIKSRDLLHTP